jgi:hypothetical protein
MPRYYDIIIIIIIVIIMIGLWAIMFERKEIRI